MRYEQRRYEDRAPSSRNSTNKSCYAPVDEDESDEEARELQWQESVGVAGLELPG